MLAGVRGEERPMRTMRGVTRGDLLVLAVAVVAIALMAAVFLAAPHINLRWPPFGPRGESRRIRCRDNLQALYKGMLAYVGAEGGGVWYPCPLGRGADPRGYNGAEWLASLYWTRLIPDPSVFLCPSTPDANHHGYDLHTHWAIPGRFGSQTVSYAGMHWRSGQVHTAPPSAPHRPVTGTRGWPPRPWATYYVETRADGSTEGALRRGFPLQLPMICDDMQGPINHGERSNSGLSVLFFDGHIEFRTNTEIDTEKGVGWEGGLLWQLRN
jgi:hypothetical protein